MSTEQNRRITAVVQDGGRRLLGFIRARVKSDADAEDVLQDVWHQLAVALNTGPIEQVSAWLYTVARRRIIDRQRKPAMDSLDALTDAETTLGPEFAEILLRDDHTPRAEHLRRRFWEELRTALDELPEAQRQVFIWHELDGLSFHDIVRRTGEKRNTLLSRKRYAILHLRERLAGLRSEFALPEPDFPTRIVLPL